jgi:Leucine-rich repeat (LRR) protein
MKSFRSTNLFSVLLLFATVLPLTGCPSDLIYIRDAGLDSAIRAEIGKPFGMLTRQDLLEVQTLDARNFGIRNLSGIEKCANLRWLDLDTNNVSDISPLEHLGRPDDPFASPLVYVNLDSNEVNDLTPLAGLLNLQQVSLFDNQIANLSPLVTNAMNGGLGAGDSVIIDLNTLSDQALNVDIPTLQSLGVQVITVVPEGDGGTE